MIMNINRGLFLKNALVQRRNVFDFINNLRTSAIKLCDRANSKHDTLVQDKSSAKIIFISDTHSDHIKLGTLPLGDILIHSGKYEMFVWHLIFILNFR